MDGIIDGYPGDYTKEWATVGQLAGAWIRLTWSTPVQITKVVLWDRPNLSDNVLAGTLTFSDGSSSSVGTLPNDASSGYTVTFPTKTVSWVQFTVTSAIGMNIGLAEMQVFGAGASTAISSVTLSPSSVAGGGQSQGTVNLSAAAPTGGATVNLSSSNTGIAAVPTAVTVPAGSTSSTFAVSTVSVASNSTVTISASYGGTTQSAVLSVTTSATNTVGSGDLALNATATVSSQNTSTGQLGSKAIDGIIDGYPGDYTKEWATVGQLAGAWIRLTWASPVTLVEIILHDRPNLSDNVLAGNLQFSDGSSLNVGQLPNDGTGLTITFPVRTVSWVQFNVTNAAGQNIGLAEFEAYGGSLTGLQLSPDPVSGGSTSQGTVQAAAPAPSGGTSIALSSSNTSLAAVPATVTIPAGATSATFAVTTSAVASSASAAITATAPDTSSLSSTLVVTTGSANNVVGSGDLALNATATVSSQNTSTGQLSSKAIDGIIDGYPGDYTKEWASVGQLAGSWILFFTIAPT